MHILFILIGLVFIIISIPLLFEKIGPNNWYGFRTPKTLSNREIWFKANKYMAKYFILLGAAQIIYSILIAFKPFVLHCELAGNLVILIGGTLLVCVKSLLYLGKL